MEEPIESAYFNWLCSKVMWVEVPTPSLEFWDLLKILHSVEFVWLIPGDDNRSQDGVDLRTEFLNESHLDRDAFWLNVGCSVLEMLIAFSSKAEFETDQSAREWFWIFLENLGLADLNDATYPDPMEIDDILQRFIWRTYEKNGAGGMFPLSNPYHDQTTVEIWYQFCEYLVDQDRY